MAKTTIKSTSITLDGLVHNLDDRDRVAAQLASDTALNLKINVTSLGDGISTKQLTADDCGIVTLGVVGTETAVTKGFNVDLPAPVAGLYYKFIFVGPSIANNANAAITITSNSDNSSTAADLCVGSILGNGDDNGANVVAVADITTFVHNKATAGDFAEFICDGTNWFVDARYDADGSITLA